ncbi:MAG: hypothetical protein ACRESJ_04350 [Pseudomonas sp.]|uniref:hypothetical protein n=1 Tax=Pseudomonas sp. TaxID=306 RepID=UPI003D6FF67D
MSVLRLCALIAATFMMVSAGTAWATEQGQQRRAARDVRQETRQDARQTKQDCRAADQKNNYQCRQDKRHTKQQGRERARDIKY